MSTGATICRTHASYYMHEGVLGGERISVVIVMRVMDSIYGIGRLSCRGETFGQELRTSHRTVKVMQTRDWITTIKE